MSDHKTLGVIDGKLASMPKSPNAVSSQTTDPAKHISALPMSGSTLETKNKIVDCLRKIGGNTIKSETDHYIHSVFVTPVMRFKDDVEFYIDETEQQVHYRSASRIGYSDLGANRKRYQAFNALYSG